MTDLIEEYEKHLHHLRRSPTTIEGYIGILRRMDAQMPAGLASATTDELEAWIFTPGRGDTTLAHYVTVVTGWGRWATNRESPWLDYDATAELPDIAPSTEKPVRPVTEDEFADILARAQEPYRDLYLLAGYAGMRSIEIAGIDREHLTETEIRIFGKGRKWRQVATHPRLWERFGGRPPGPLATDRQGRPLSRAQVVSWGNNHVKRALGYRDLSMHCFRKRFATALYEKCGRDPVIVQEALGHTSLAHTQRYLGVDRKRSAAAVVALA